MPARGRPPAVDVRGLGVALGGRQVLDGVSFSLAPGEMVGLIGANGAGKTTLLRALLGLQPLCAGTVKPRAGSAGSPPAGYVPQRIVLDPDLPVRARDLVRLGLDGARLGPPLPSRAKRRAVADLLGSVGAGHLADARVGALSGGEQQRVLIAHALARRPRLLLLDEPLANLDLRSTQETVSLLSRVARHQGVAVLLSAHDINPLLAVMDRVVYLAAGRAMSGTVDEVVTSERLSHLYGHQVDVFRAHGRVIVSVGPEQGHDRPA